MAADDKDRDGGSRDGADQELERFVDRDDDSSNSLIDSDYADDFPGFAGEASEDGNDSEPEDADPGYAAFAGEFVDPLADWPSPDAPLEELPDTPQGHSADPTLEQPASSTGSPWPHSDGQNDDHRADRSTGAGGSFDSGQWGPGAEPGQAETDELLFETGYEPEGGADVVDSDSLPANKTRLADFDIDDLSDIGKLGKPEETTAVRSQSVDEVPAAPGEDVPGAGGDFDEYEYSLSPEQEDAFEDELEDEFVDDFLNDLDMPDSPPTDAQSRQQAASRIEERSPDEAGLYPDMGKESMSAGGLAAAGAAGSSVERASFDHSDGHTDEPARQAPRRAGSADEGDDGRSLPVAMIVVVFVALALLGVGGYGVVQQRGELQSEIRDLQARLATTVTPEEAEVERERQRQVQIENESLNAELEALVAENAALGEQVASLESRVAEQARLTEEAAERAEEAAAQAAAAERQAQQASRANTSGASAERVGAAGPWFVNFGSYADRAVAERWAAKLGVDDGKVLVQTATAAGKTLYRVRVVSLSSQDAAERVATALEREYQLPRLWVGKN